MCKGPVVDTGLVRGRARAGRCMAATDPGREGDRCLELDRGVNKIDSIMMQERHCREPRRQGPGVLPGGRDMSWVWEDGLAGKGRSGTRLVARFPGGCIEVWISGSTGKKASWTDMVGTSERQAESWCFLSLAPVLLF